MADKAIVFEFQNLGVYYSLRRITYTAAGGGHVDISFPINPWEVLGLQSNASQEDIKRAFRNQTNQSSRQNRAKISIANHILTSSAERKCDYFMLAAAGHAQALASRIESEEDILETFDEYGRTLLYLASKSGFYDTCKMLLKKGASINKTQRDGSTALHTAAYYGHTLVVGLLLEHGAATDIKNRWGSTALEEARCTDQIKSFIRDASKDCIKSLLANLKKKGLVSSVRSVEYRGKIIGKELIRELESLDSSTKARWHNITETWEPVWHGTQYKNLPAIFEKGLLPTGSHGIQPREGHISLGRSNFKINNWAAAIFVSPSIQYAGHAVYSERVLSESRQWCVLVKALCKPGSYESFDPTTSPKYDRQMDGEPDEPEYRVPVRDLNKQVILRVESSRSVVVQSLVFVSLDFLENEEISFMEAKKIFADEDQPKSSSTKDLAKELSRLLK